MVRTTVLVQIKLADADTVPWSCDVAGQSPAIAAQVQGRSPPPSRFPAMGCSGSIQSIEYTTTLSPCKGKELVVVEKGSKKVTAKSGLKHVWCFGLSLNVMFFLSVPWFEGVLLTVYSGWSQQPGELWLQESELRQHPTARNWGGRREKVFEGGQLARSIAAAVLGNDRCQWSDPGRESEPETPQGLWTAGKRSLLSWEQYVSMWKYRETREASESPTGEPTAIFLFYGPCVAWMACEGTCWSTSHWPYSLKIYCSLLSTLVGASLKTTWVCIVCTSHVPPVERFFPCTIIWSFCWVFSFLSQERGWICCLQCWQASFRQCTDFQFWGLVRSLLKNHESFLGLHGGPASRGSWVGLMVSITKVRNGTRKAVPVDLGWS